MSEGQIMSWYHSKILRIPHGKQNPTKRYLDEEQVLNLFDGVVLIQEKVDGKLSVEIDDNADIKDRFFRTYTLYEDMTGKHTVHKHIMHYDKLPPNKKIKLEWINYFKEEFSKKDFYQFTHIHMSMTAVKLDNTYDCPSGLNYAQIMLLNPSKQQIYDILTWFSKQPSHFGNDKIEGLVIKNYKKQLMGKWINDEFEDQLDSRG